MYTYCRLTRSEISEIASIYIKGDAIYFHNEKGNYSNIGGLAYELRKPLLNFVCYEPERFIDAYSVIAETYDNDYAHIGVKDPEFIAALKESMSETQKHEPYIYFYSQMLTEFIYTFIESPKQAILALEDKMPGAEEKLSWTIDLEWPTAKSPYVQVAHYADKGRRLFRAARDVVVVMYDHLCRFQKCIIHEIEVLLHYREEIKVPDGRSIDYIDILDEYHDILGLRSCYLEKAFKTFYGRATDGKVEQLYEIDSVEDFSDLSL